MTPDKPPETYFCSFQNIGSRESADYVPCLRLPAGKRDMRRIFVRLENPENPLAMPSDMPSSRDPFFIFSNGTRDDTRAFLL